MKKYLLPLFFFACQNCPAQFQSVEKEIEQHISANRTTIPDIREIMMQKIDSGLTEQARQIYRYCTTIYEPKGKLVFYNEERILVGFMIQDYSYILQRIGEIQEGKINSRNYYQYSMDPKIAVPGNDRLYRYLMEKSTKEINRLGNGISKSALDKEIQELLEIYLYFFMDKDTNNATGAVQLLERVKKFQQQYPGSKYKKFISENVEKSLQPKKFRYGMEINFNFQSPKDSLGYYIKNAGGFSLLLNGNWKNWLLQTGYIYNSFSLQKKVVVKNDIWQPDSVLELHQIQLHAGYLIIDTKRLSLYPYIGTAVSMLQPMHNAPTQNRKTKAYSLAAPETGIKLLWKWKRTMDSYSVRKGGDGYNYCAFGVNYQKYQFKHLPQLSGKNISFSLTAFAHLADISTFFLFYWGSKGHRNESW